jgi:hypothetical protein
MVRSKVGIFATNRTPVMSAREPEVLHHCGINIGLVDCLRCLDFRFLLEAFRIHHDDEESIAIMTASVVCGCYIILRMPQCSREEWCARRVGTQLLSIMGAMCRLSRAALPRIPQGKSIVLGIWRAPLRLLPGSLDLADPGPGCNLSNNTRR